MRVIGGAFRGRKLTPLKGKSIRPTADRVREALFNIIGRKTIDANVLDLFAGTGALGIESLSRGAARAVFVEQASSSLAIIHKNISLCKIEEKSKIIQWDILKNLNCLHSYQGCFNLIFIDPPYNQQMAEPALRHLASGRLPAPDAIAVVEHNPAQGVQSPVPEWIAIDQRRYGRTQLSFFRFNANRTNT